MILRSIWVLETSSGSSLLHDSCAILQWWQLEGSVCAKYDSCEQIFWVAPRFQNSRAMRAQNVDIVQQGSLIMIRFKNKNKKQLREQCAFDDNNSTVNSFPLQNDKSKWYLTNIQCIHKYSSSLMTCLSIKSMQSLVLRCVHFTVHCCHLAACPPPLPPLPSSIHLYKLCTFRQCEVQGGFLTGSWKSCLCVDAQTKLVPQFFVFINHRGYQFSLN